MENREQQLREEAEKHCSGYNHGIRDQLINICVDFAKSEAAKQYHSDAVEFEGLVDVLEKAANSLEIQANERGKQNVLVPKLRRWIDKLSHK